VEKETDTRTALIEAAKTVFAQRGYDGATVKELAEAAGVNISLVSYYFNGKEGLYRACLEELGRGGTEMATRVLKNPESIEDFRVRLKLFLEEMIQGHFAEKDLMAIIHRECAVDNSLTMQTFKQVFVKIFETLTQFFKASQKAGIIRKDIDVHTTSLLFWGGVMHALRFDTLQKELFGQSIEDKKTREQFIDHAIQNLLEGTQRRTP
jgi:AcrR family transcriptional regulator